MTSPADVTDADAATAAPVDVGGVSRRDHRPNWVQPLLLLIVSSALLSLAFAPFGQFYLAWVALAPWLMVVRRAATMGRAVAWGWLGAFLFFMPNFSYLLVITAPGAVALSMYMALFWAIVAIVLRATGALEPKHDNMTFGSTLAACVMIAIVWVAGEWLRGTLLTGLPWLYIGHTQSQLAVMCQVADFSGTYGVSFWIALVNAVVFFAISGCATERRKLLAPAALASIVVLAVLSYGIFRLAQTESLYSGPKLLLIQPNDRHVRGKTEPGRQEKTVQFHTETTLDALTKEPVDLVVWSETTMPPLNSEARKYSSDPTKLSQRVHIGLTGLTGSNRTSLLAGGYYVGNWQPAADGKLRATDFRNSAYFYNPFRREYARYDKVHIVPFGEFIPFRISLPWLFQAFMWLSPYHEEYTISAGPENELTVFTLDPGAGTPDAKAGTTWRFVTPICFEDIDAPLVARMFRGGGGESGAKRADFIVNITNDGWFRFNQMPHHLQVAIFRSIENRAPTARSVNTGISAFVDSYGRVQASVRVGQTGAISQRLTLDRRVSLYTRFGDVFAVTATVIAGILTLAAVVSHLLARARARRQKIA